MAARRQAARRETSAGGIVVRCAPEGPRVLLIHDAHRNWGFPKGHVDDGEAAEDAARREVAEETGVEVLRMHAPLGTIDWYFRARGRLIRKYCHFFLFSTDQADTSPQREEGIRACRWLSVGEAVETVTHDNARDVLTKAERFIARLCPAGEPT
jgi:8-oxo-dGTP pyrophosphatase MutT (NUDIX family)